MQKTLAFALCAAVGAAASAHPFGEKWSTPTPGPVGVPSEAIELDEGFEDYAVGDGVTTMGGWELWPGGFDATVTDAQAASGTKSANFSMTSIDVVHQFSGIDSGKVTFGADIYITSTGDAVYYMIALNQYDGGGPATHWSVQVEFSALAGTVSAQTSLGTFPTTLVYDEWVPFRVEVDLDADLVDYFYDGVEFASDIPWTTGVSGAGGMPIFAAIDLFTSAATTGNDVYVDNVLVETEGGGCYADCDQSGTLDFFDFLCFQDAFAAGDPYADCDGSTTLDFFDFLCFQDEFAAGCL